jgi:5-methylcytosine-specific restriction endonuclease McrA
MSGYLRKSEREKLPVATFMRSPLRQAVWSKTGGRCLYCGCDFIPDKALSPGSDGLIRQPKNTDMTIDHGTPRNRGGKHDLNNLFPACLSCNSTKGAKTIEEFICG